MSTVKKAAAVAKRHTKDNMDVGMMCDVSTLALRTYLCENGRPGHAEADAPGLVTSRYMCIDIGQKKRAIQILIASEIRNRTEHINTNGIRTYRFVVNTAL
jgi:hypothetical protein